MTNTAARGAPPSSETVLRELLVAVRASGCRAWLVGGTVRDRYMGRECADLDVVLEEESAGFVRDLATQLASTLRTPHFTLSSDFGGERIVWWGGHLDLSPLRGRCIEEDLALRDFTVNAVALPLEGGPPCDPFGGIDDIARRRLVAVRDTTFRADPVRLLRVVRFAQTHVLAVDPNTAALARRDAHLLHGAAPERLRTEVVATLQAGSSSRATVLWDDLGLLAHLFPEVAALRGEAQSAEDGGDVYGHTLDSLDRVDSLLEAPQYVFPDSTDVLLERLQQNVDGSASRTAVLRLAVLLHNIATPSARHVDERGRLSRPDPEGEGALSARAVCARLKCSTAITGLVAKVVEEHAWLGRLQDRGQFRTRDEIEYLWGTSPWEPEVIVASVADQPVGRGPVADDGSVSRRMVLARRLMWRWSERSRRGVPSLPIRGDELGRLVGVSQGPELGALLRLLRLEWEAGELANRDEVVARAIIMRS